jgi:hypothetical protein
MLIHTLLIFILNSSYANTKSLSLFLRYCLNIMLFVKNIRVVVVKAMCYKPEGRGFETRCGE